MNVRMSSFTRSGYPESPITESAWNIKASPARMAVASPNFAWHVGRPLLMSSLSKAGRSSWMRLKVWIISIARPAGNVSGAFPPRLSHAIMASTGRILFPPDLRLYENASKIPEEASAVSR